MNLFRVCIALSAYLILTAYMGINPLRHKVDFVATARPLVAQTHAAQTATEQSHSVPKYIP
jgi:hypothetical protein